jgi:hypothetical protein
MGNLLCGRALYYGEKLKTIHKEKYKYSIQIHFQPSLLLQELWHIQPQWKIKASVAVFKGGPHQIISST